LRIFTKSRVSEGTLDYCKGAKTAFRKAIKYQQLENSN